jgi:hypothetical protein
MDLCFDYFSKERFMANDFKDDKNKQQSGKQEPTGSVNTTDRTKNDPSRGSEHQSGQNSQDKFNRTPTSSPDSKNRKDPDGSEQVEEKRRAS